MQIKVNEIFQQNKTPRITARTFLENPGDFNAFKCVNLAWCIVLESPYIVFIISSLTSATNLLGVWHKVDFIRKHGGLDVEKVGTVRDIECTIVEVKEY